MKRGASVLEQSLRAANLGVDFGAPGLRADALRATRAQKALRVFKNLGVFDGLDAFEMCDERRGRVFDARFGEFQRQRLNRGRIERVL